MTRKILWNGGRICEGGKSESWELPREETEGNAGIMDFTNADPAGERGGQHDFLDHGSVGVSAKITGEVTDRGSAHDGWEETGKRRSST